MFDFYKCIQIAIQIAINIARLIFKLLDHPNFTGPYFRERYISSYWYLLFLFSEKQQILKLVYDHQLYFLIYFAVKGNGTVLIGIDDTASDVQALNLLNSSDLP